MADVNDDCYRKCYVGHKGKFGYEFLKFEFRSDGKLRYANNSNYKNDTLICKETYINRTVIEELERICADRQDLEIVLGDEHISFSTSKICSLIDINNSLDPDS
ncbi:unnamed protein product [Rotaria magnacalcarata]|uniref:Uncharacterized protein n=1 Tax=Rotaria magnacalcarata TaxID=392030 RepID=A0A816FBC7_9BILA|nr:unnamed protein product [Rotaria magnacalcarata]CAF4632961.1 unnamed protein product [Rotaria magnacalcarata]